MTAPMPKKGSSQDRVLMYLYDHGPQTLTTLQKQTGIMRQVIVKALRDYGCVNTQFGWRLATGQKTTFEKLYPKSAIAQTRCTTIWTPEMKCYEERMRQGRRYE